MEGEVVRRINEAYRNNTEDVEILTVNLGEGEVVINRFVERNNLDFPGSYNECWEKIKGIQFACNISH